MQKCSSQNCGAFWLNPAPHPDELPLAYRGYYTHSAANEDRQKSGFRLSVRKSFSRQHLDYPVTTGWKLNLLGKLVNALPEHSESAQYSLFYLPWKMGGRLLEIGCGSGAQLKLMLDAGWEAVGIDFDLAAATAARAQGLEVDVGDVRTMNYPESSFDAIVMAHVIEHVYDPVGLLTECTRLLKPGGRLVSITPNAGSLGHRIYRQAWRGLEPPRHIAVFTRQALSLAAKRAGLNVDRVRVTARDAANLLLASSRMAQAKEGEQILHPKADKLPPLKLRALARLEWIANHCGLAWGEELVLMAHKPSR